MAFQQRLDFQVIGCSSPCQEFPASNLVAVNHEQEHNTNSNNNNDNNSNDHNRGSRNTLFQTDRVLYNKTRIELDFGRPVVVLGAVASSSTCSHIEVYASSWNPDFLAAAQKDDGDGGTDGGDLRASEATPHQHLTAKDLAKRYLILEKKQFCSPLAHRARYQLQVQRAEAKQQSALLPHQRLLLQHDSQNNGTSANEHLPLPLQQQDDNIANDEQDVSTVRMKSVIPPPTKKNLLDPNVKLTASPPPFVRYIDVDLEAVWEPRMRTSLNSLAFIGYVATKEMIREWIAKATRETSEDFLQKQQQQQIQQKPQESGARREREAPVPARPSLPSSPMKIPPKPVQQQQNQEQPQQQQQQQLLQVTDIPAPTPAPKQQPDPNLPVLANCVLVLSGFQNPGRGELRQKALNLGAKVVNDWDVTCTHLICAFAGTPKYNEVMMDARNKVGWIVSDDWIKDSDVMKKRCDERNYLVGTGGPAASMPE